MTAPPLPELSDALVPPETVNALFEDLARLTEVQHVIARPRAQRMVDTGDVPLALAHARLMAGELSGVQVLYRWDGHTWRDAILAGPGGFRIVRIQVS